MAKIFPKLKTERLVLRQLEEKDNTVIQFLRSDDSVNAYIKRPRTNTLEEANQFIIKINKGIETEELLYWSITLNDRPELIGNISLWHFSEDRSIAEVGYDLHPKFHGQGIMTEALQCILSYGFDILNLKEIEAFTHQNNEPSKKLLLKNNFEHIENRKDDNNADNIIFSLSRAQHFK